MNMPACTLFRTKERTEPPEYYHMIRIVKTKCTSEKGLLSQGKKRKLSLSPFLKQIISRISRQKGSSYAVMSNASTERLGNVLQNYRKRLCIFMTNTRKAF